MVERGGGTGGGAAVDVGADSGNGETEGVAPVLPEDGGGDVAVVGTGERAGLDGGKSCEERRVVAVGEEAVRVVAMVRMSTADGGVVTKEGAVEARTGGSEEVSVGGESDEEDWKHWDLCRLACGRIVDRAAAAVEGDAEGGARGGVVARGGALDCPTGVVTCESEEE